MVNIFTLTLTLVNYCVIVADTHDFYQLTPAKIGCEVHGIDIGLPVSEKVIAQIKKDVTEHRILVFRNQHNIPPERHVEIGRWFGELESSMFYKHPKSPSPEIFRISNVKSEGSINRGRFGWHIDGSHFMKPVSHTLYQIVHVPNEGDTVYNPLNEIVQGLSTERLDRWERLWVRSNPPPQVIHPLIYSHPDTGKKVICIHLGTTASFIWDRGTNNERETGFDETKELLAEIKHEFTKNQTLQYSHKWEVGDYIITDNLSVAHESAPSSQYSIEQVGLRVLHRVTVAGTNMPTKNYDLPILKPKDEL
ncbi:alpha-ketoglutarate-dependent taurine dioxygenase-like [Saccoglossus kowalevskii]|uniref:Uncharacterized protein LOC100378824 n=1 Tax=Saccoglossus kowalevskii TaxID=10224 RepID=A0ABM0GSA4_SACKO|nr:PREDICTED: uncharacterized protein LOC100378824 [Saccoglossus kowalevskii]